MDQNNLKNFLQLLIRKQQEETARQKARDSIQMKEIEKITCLLQSTLPVTQESSSIPLTKMTPQDDPAAFLKTFERLARHNHWPEETWALRLAPLLCGEAQLAYAGLADTDALTYAKVKETILRHFKTASDLYRQEFRSLKMLPGACPRFVAQRLNDLANLWLKPVETEKMKLFDKVVLEQFLNILPKETQEWVKMLQPEDLESAVIYTESFAEGTESVSESTGQVASEPRMSPASSHMAGYVLPAAKIASSIGTAPPRQREQIVPPYLCDENINTVRAGADGVQMNLSLQWKGKKKCNEDHAFIPRKRYRPENDEQFQKYYNMEEKSRIVITKMHEKLQYLFNNEENETAFVSELKEKITNLKQKHLYEEMFIGIFGKTGTGKSSLINALLNEKTLLPTSSRKACTSCIIQVQVHENNRLVYKAEIEFISKEEWEEELKELIENCKQDHNEDSSYTEDGQEAESELAKEKIMAVYGKDGLNKSFFELANLKILDTLKGSKVFFSKTGSELSEKINQYIRSESDDETSRSYWPLVKVVKLHVPKACGLPDQVVLVDIPGTGDSNKDRNKMWKEYISKCNSIWIVTDITRAESDRNALEILNTGLRGIAGGGECQNITYICTKTDEIGIQMGIQSGHKTQRISGHAEPDDDSKLKRDTILMRNTKVKEKINDKCNKIVKKFLFGLEDNSAGNPIKVFTVSSKEFWNTKEGINNVLTDEETELPSLKKHVKELYVNQTKKAVEHYVSEVSGIISFLHVPKENAEEKADENEALYVQLNKNLTVEIGNLVVFFGNVSRKLEGELTQGVESAEKQCLNIVQKLLKPGRTNLGGYHQTIKALCHNSGSFRSSKGDVIDLNNELASPIYAVVDNTLKSSFQLNQSTRRSIKAALELLQLKFENDAIFTKKKAGQSYRLVFIKTELRRVLVLLEKKILQSKKIIYNSIVKSIQDGMDPVYKEASKEKGRNFMSKIHTMFEDKIKQSRNCMFKEATMNMLNEFTKLKDEVRETLQQKMDASMKLALAQFPEGVHFPDSTDELKEMKNLCDLLSLNIF